MAEYLDSEKGQYHMVCFTVGDEEFGINILKVQEIIRMVDITKIPNAPSAVEGIINLRGKVIPVMDFRKKFNVDAMDVERSTQRIIVISLETTTVGVIVDGLSQVVMFSADQVSEPPQAVKGYDSEAIMGIGKQGEHLIILLDPRKLVGEVDMDVLQIAA